MDVVRRNIKELGGNIELRSDAGQGLELHHHAAAHAGHRRRPVRVGRQRDLHRAARLHRRIDAAEARRTSAALSGQGEVFSFRGDYLPIVRLHELFGVEPRTKRAARRPDHGRRRRGPQRVGLFVDDLLGQQQVVIKSLETNYGHVEGVSGATILGDGSVALILDIPGLIRAISMRAAA